MPGEPLLVELDDGLRAPHIGLAGGHEIGLVASLPLDQEHELARGVGGSDDALGIQVAVEAAGAFVFRLLLLAGVGAASNRLALVAGSGRAGLVLLGLFALRFEGLNQIL